MCTGCSCGAPLDDDHIRSAVEGADYQLATVLTAPPSGVRFALREPNR
ncbi:hypothetical protein ABZS29_11990 [Kribbella sp. NPDC005582]